MAKLWAFAIHFVVLAMAQIPGFPHRISLGGNVKPPEPIKRVEPLYPEAARLARIQGMVRLTLFVGVDGHVMKAWVISGHPLLAEAALTAVKEWIYPPITLANHVVEAVFDVDLSFGKDDNSSPDRLMERGAGLSAEEAQQVEEKLASQGDDAAARAQLLGYTAQKQIAKRRQTLAWFVTNDPGSSILAGKDAALVERGNSLADPEGHELLKSLWLQNPALSRPTRSSG